MPSILNRSNAERAAEHLAVNQLGCIITIRAIRTQYNRQDLFAADVLGKTKDGALVAIQATTGGHSAMTARRRKLEGVPWAAQDRVLIAQLKEYKDPTNTRKLLYAFRISEYSDGGWMNWPAFVPVLREWFKPLND